MKPKKTSIILAGILLVIFILATAVYVFGFKRVTGIIKGPEPLNPFNFVLKSMLGRGTVSFIELAVKYEDIIIILACDNMKMGCADNKIESNFLQLMELRANSIQSDAIVFISQNPYTLNEKDRMIIDTNENIYALYGSDAIKSYLWFKRQIEDKRVNIAFNSNLNYPSYMLLFGLVVAGNQGEMNHEHAEEELVQGLPVYDIYHAKIAMGNNEEYLAALAKMDRYILGVPDLIDYGSMILNDKMLLRSLDDNSVPYNGETQDNPDTEVRGENSDIYNDNTETPDLGNIND